MQFTNIFSCCLDEEGSEILFEVFSFFSFVSLFRCSDVDEDKETLHLGEGLRASMEYFVGEDVFHLRHTYSHHPYKSTYT